MVNGIAGNTCTDTNYWIHPLSTIFVCVCVCVSVQKCSLKVTAVMGFIMYMAPEYFIK